MIRNCKECKYKPTLSRYSDKCAGCQTQPDANGTLFEPKVDGSVSIDIKNAVPLYAWYGRDGIIPNSDNQPVKKEAIRLPEKMNTEIKTQHADYLNAHKELLDAISSANKNMGKLQPIPVITGLKSAAYSEAKLLRELNEAGALREAGKTEVANEVKPVEVSTTHELQAVFDAVIHQVTKGKGERHGGESAPFLLQPWHSIAQQTGPGGLVFQGMKKAGEACSKPDKATFERELLGAIAYLSMAYLYIQEHGFTGVVK